MGKRYFIELSRKDIALVSYFPGMEIKDNPDADWIEEVLVPAIEPIARRKSAKIQEMPITFWIGVRGTARHRAEIFLFMTPAFPRATLEQALNQALLPVTDARVHAGREPIPDEALPCLQVFRGDLITFYSVLDGYEGFYLPTIQWKDDAPALALLPILENAELIVVDVLIEEAKRLLAEARILPVSDGKLCRKFQQALIPVARQVD